MGPTNRTLSISPDVNNPAFRAITFDQSRGLRGPGARPDRRRRRYPAPRDDLRHAERKGGDRGHREVFEETGVRLPLMISVTITDRSGRTLSGQTVDAFYVSIRHAQAVLRRHQLRARRARHAPVPRGAGAHRRMLHQLLPERRPAERLRRVRRAAATKPPSCCAISPSSGFVNILGGCCGTTPDHIKAVARAIEELSRGRCPLKLVVGSGMRMRDRSNRDRRIPDPDRGSRLRNSPASKRSPSVPTAISR